MPAIMLISGIVLGAIATYLVSRVHVRASEEQIREARAQCELLRGERDQALAEVKTLHEQLTGNHEASNRELTELRARLTEAQTTLATARAELQAERNAHEERVAELRAIEANIDERVKAATAGALKDTAPQLVALAVGQGSRRGEGRDGRRAHASRPAGRRCREDADAHGRPTG